MRTCWLPPPRYPFDGTCGCAQATRRPRPQPGRTCTCMHATWHKPFVRTHQGYLEEVATGALVRERLQLLAPLHVLDLNFVVGHGCAVAPGLTAAGLVPLQGETVTSGLPPPSWWLRSCTTTVWQGRSYCRPAVWGAQGGLCAICVSSVMMIKKTPAGIATLWVGPRWESRSRRVRGRAMERPNVQRRSRGRWVPRSQSPHQNAISKVPAHT